MKYILFCVIILAKNMEVLRYEKCYKSVLLFVKKKKESIIFFNYECKDIRKVYVDGIEDIRNSDKFRKFINMIKGA